ncbi:MAG: hypothetical protein Q7Q71_06280 [Verrucomicrobiota bacterium JB023]|nr:hypothetical protein [Verrucomicrobiota bacterium JB023]
MKAILVATFGTLLLASLAAEPVVFTIDQSDIQRSIYFSSGQSDSANAPFSGTLVAEVQLDEDGGLTSFHFIGGRYLDEGSEFTFNFGTIPSTSSFTLASRQIGISPFSEGDGPGIDGETGLLDDFSHYWIADAGMIVLSYGPFEEVLRDYSAVPLTSNFLSSTSVSQDWRLTSALGVRTGLALNISLDHLENYTLVPENPPDNPGLSAQVQVIGETIARGEHFSPSEEFTAWLTHHSQSIEHLDTINPETGMPLALLFALRLPADALTLGLEVEPLTRVARMELPAEGPRVPLSLEVSPDMATWSELDSDGRLQGGPTFAVSDTGAVEVPLPDWPRLFIRLRTDD